VHAAGIVHRDVKPANILADQAGSIYLVDFGIAKISGDSPSGGWSTDGSITGRGRVLGTPEYISPEQLIGRPATPASDLWSLGVTLYTALEGHTPFARRPAQSAQAVRAAILYEEPLVPTSAGPLPDIVLRLLQKEPGHRPGVEEVATVLESILNASQQPPRQARTPTGAQHQTTDYAEEQKQTLVYTRKLTRPFDDAELSRREMADAVRIVNQSGADSGVAVLLTKPDVEAARILADCSLEVASELVAGIAAGHPRKAGAILEILSVTRSGKVLDYMPPASGAAVIAAMPRNQRPRVLSQSHVRTVADILRVLPTGIAAELIAAMPDKRAAAVLCHVRPAIVAAILSAVSPDLSARLLPTLSADIRALVERYL
jgi:flagellar motility protein MotE (MotC chaperone)